MERRNVIIKSCKRYTKMNKVKRGRNIASVPSLLRVYLVFLFCDLGIFFSYHYLDLLGDLKDRVSRDIKGGVGTVSGPTLSGSSYFPPDEC